MYSSTTYRYEYFGFRFRRGAKVLLLLLLRSCQLPYVRRRISPAVRPNPLQNHTERRRARQDTPLPPCRSWHSLSDLGCNLGPAGRRYMAYVSKGFRSLFLLEETYDMTTVNLCSHLPRYPCGFLQFR
jgi:hypothetical protein